MFWLKSKPPSLPALWWSLGAIIGSCQVSNGAAHCGGGPEWRWKGPVAWRRAGRAVVLPPSLPTWALAGETGPGLEVFQSSLVCGLGFGVLPGPSWCRRQQTHKQNIKKQKWGKSLQVFLWSMSFIPSLLLLPIVQSLFRGVLCKFARVLRFLPSVVECAYSVLTEMTSVCSSFVQVNPVYFLYIFQGFFSFCFTKSALLRSTFLVLFISSLNPFLHFWGFWILYGLDRGSHTGSPECPLESSLWIGQGTPHWAQTAHLDFQVPLLVPLPSSDGEQCWLLLADAAGHCPVGLLLCISGWTGPSTQWSGGTGIWRYLLVAWSHRSWVHRQAVPPWCQLQFTYRSDCFTRKVEAFLSISSWPLTFFCCWDCSGEPFFSQIPCTEGGSSSDWEFASAEMTAWIFSWG